VEAGATLGIGALVAAFCLLVALLSPAFFWHDDCQFGGVPGMIDFQRALAAGEWPLLTPYTWNFATYLGEFQGGIFSPIILPAMALAPLLGKTQPDIAAAYATMLLAFTAMGAFRVGRQEGLACELAGLVAVVAALNGWSMGWAASNWIPAMSGFACLVWAWWALGALAKPGAGVRLTLVGGLAIYLLQTAGWPHTIFQGAVVTAWLLLRTLVVHRTAWPVLPVVTAWLMGIGLSAPAWLPFLEYLGVTNRPAVGVALQWEWLVPVGSLPALVLPDWTSFWSVYNEDRMHRGTELANGLVPTAALIGALLIGRRDVLRAIGWPLLLAGIGLALCALPSVGMFRWSFRWLSLFHMSLALSAAHAIAQLRGPVVPAWCTGASAVRLARNPAVWGLVAVALVAAAERQRVVSAPTLAFVSAVALAAWALVEDRLPAAHLVRRWMPMAATLVILLTTYTAIPNGLAVPFWRLTEENRQVAPLDPTFRYLAVTSPVDYFRNSMKLERWGTITRPGNTMLAAGVTLINGYSALQHKGLLTTFEFGLHGFLHSASINRVAADSTKAGALLSRIGVDGLLVGRVPKALVKQIEDNGWSVVLTEPEGSVMRRRGPSNPTVRAVPAVRVGEDADKANWWKLQDRTDGIPVIDADAEHPADTTLAFVPRPVTLIGDHRNYAVFEIGPGTAPAMVAIARVWLPGYQALAPDGRELAIRALDGISIGVEIPSDVSGRITLRYLPRSLVRGFWIAGGTLALMLLALAWDRRRLRRGPAAVLAH
jgi:hypothetical protein